MIFSSSWQAWPDTWRGRLPLVDHVGPLAVELIDDVAHGVLVARMVEAETITLSPGWMSTWRWVEKAILDRADDSLALTAGGDDAHLVLAE